MPKIKEVWNCLVNQKRKRYLVGKRDIVLGKNVPGYQ